MVSSCYPGDPHAAWEGHWAGALFAKTGSLFCGCGWREALSALSQAYLRSGHKGLWPRCWELVPPLP